MEKITEYLSRSKIDAFKVKVQDEGVGIPEDELEDIFDTFAQSSNTKTGAGGTGLGLSITRKIIDAHGGEIWAENNKTIGASFIFIIPTHYAGKGE